MRSVVSYLGNHSS